MAAEMGGFGGLVELASSCSSPVLAIWTTRQLWFDGLVNGMVFGLLALGIVLVFRSTRVINLAVGIILGAIALSVALAFGIGGREVAAQQLEDWTT